MEDNQIQQPQNTTAKLGIVHYERNGWKMNRMVWIDPSPEERDFKINERVWPAGEDEKSSFIVKAIKQPGEKFYPEGGVICMSSGSDRTFYPDAVIRHPYDPDKKKKVK